MCVLHTRWVPYIFSCFNMERKTLLLIHFGIIVAILLLLFSFYAWTYATVGVPMIGHFGAYMIITIIVFILLSGICVKMFDTLRIPNNTMRKKIPAHGLLHKVAVMIIFTFTVFVILLFSQRVEKKDLVDFLKDKGLGSETFLRYIHDKFNCCSLLSPKKMKLYNFYKTINNKNEYRQDTAFFQSLGCTEADQTIGCLDNIRTLDELYSKNQSAHDIHQLQIYLPLIIVFGMIFMLMESTFRLHCIPRPPRANDDDETNEEESRDSGMESTNNEDEERGPASMNHATYPRYTLDAERRERCSHNRVKSQTFELQESGYENPTFHL